MARPKSKGSYETTFLYQVSKTGKVLRTLEKSTAREVIKTVLPGTIESPIEAFSKEQGLISYGLGEANVLTALSRGAKMIEVTIKGRDQRDKTHRFKLLIEPTKQKNLDKLLIGEIVARLHAEGFRTQYTVQLFREAKQEGRARHVTWKTWRERELLSDVEMVVVIRR